MADRPIIFSAPMVRALLDGRKTQTRRKLKRQPPEQPQARCHPAHHPRHATPYLDAYCGDPRTKLNPRGMSRDWYWWQVDDRLGPWACRAPCAPGDRLWVREAFVRYHDLDEFDMRVGPLKTAYRADGGFRWLDADTDEFRDCPLWKPSIHMPRWASRLALIVTDVRVQRLQEINRGDAMEEGCPFPNMADGPSPRDWFRDLWNSLHGPDAWHANPWVVALTFTVHQCNIDRLEIANG